MQEGEDMRVWRAAAAAALTMAATAGWASTFHPTKIKCPVGGKTFSHMAYGSYSTFGELPDGQPVGSAEFPLAMPQCPDNGLVLWEEFDAAAAKRLTPLVLSPEYQAMRGTESSYYLAHWLQERLGQPAGERLWFLLAATWQAKNANDAPRARRYAEAYVAAAKALPDEPATFRTLSLKARAANALRELGRFDEAEAMRASLDVSSAVGGSEADAAETRQGWTRYLARLGPAIARRDASRAPIDMLNERDAQFRCVAPERPGSEGEPLSDFERTWCVRPEMEAPLRQLRERLKLNSLAAIRVGAAGSR